MAESMPIEPESSNSNLTQLLQAVESGDRASERELFDRVHHELKQMAQGAMRNERVGHTLQATALVNEAYLKLGGQNGWNWRSRRHFFWAAAETMRRVLIDRARQRNAVKRGAGEAKRESLSICPPQEDKDPIDILALDEALTRLDEFDERKGQVVRLRYFCGLTLEETAATLGVSRRAIDSEWRLARAFLLRELRKGDPDSATQSRNPDEGTP